MKLLYTLIAFTLLTLTLNSQTTRLDRVEIPHAKRSYYSRVLKLGDKGIVEFNRDFEDKKNCTLVFTSYSKDFVASPSVRHSLKKNFYGTSKIASYGNKGFVIARTNNQEYVLLIYNQKTNTVNQVELKSLKGSIIKAIAANSKEVYLLSTTGKPGPALSRININTGKIITEPIIVENAKKRSIRVRSLTSFPGHEEIAVDYSYFIKDVGNSRIFKIYNIDAEVTDSFDIRKSVKKVIQSVKIARMKDDSYMLTGDFSYRSLPSHLEYSQGLFVAKFKNKEQIFCKRYFSKDLAIKLKTDSAKIMEKQINLNVHPAFELDSGFALVGELFVIQYSKEKYKDGNGNTHSKFVVDGNKYRYGFTMKMSDNGDLEWEKSFYFLPDYMVDGRTSFLTVNENKKDVISIISSPDRDLSTIEYSLTGEVLKSLTHTEMTIPNEQERIDKSDARMFHWFDNTFVVHGDQYIKLDRTKKSGPKRHLNFFEIVEFK